MPQIKFVIYFLPEYILSPVFTIEGTIYSIAQARNLCIMPETSFPLQCATNLQVQMPLPLISQTYLFPSVSIITVLIQATITSL